MSGRPHPLTAAGALGAAALLGVRLSVALASPLRLAGWQVALTVASLAALLVGLDHHLPHRRLRRGVVVALVLAVSVSPELPRRCR